jgi:transposase
MGNPAGARRDFVALEQRRREAAELLRQGIHQAEVARRVGAHRQSVSRWAEQLERGGLRALRQAGRGGRKARLGPEDLRRIERGLKRGPEALGYENGLWTSARVARLIEKECGVRYHTGHAWRILRQLGWSCRRTGAGTGRREDPAMEQKRWPETKKKSKKRAEPSSSSTEVD